jgi:hypothetical protein
MVAFKILTAAALLTGTWEPPLQHNPEQMHALLAPALRELAIGWEIMDRKEADFLLAHPKDFDEHLRLLQERYQELRDAPHVAEADRLPSRDVVNDLLNFNRTYYQEVCARLEVDTIHSEELEAAKTETDLLYRIWDAVRDARCQYYHVNVRRQALQQLRQLVGDRAFYTGELPPHVPIWRLPAVE